MGTLKGALTHFTLLSDRTHFSRTHILPAKSLLAPRLLHLINILDHALSPTLFIPLLVAAFISLLLFFSIPQSQPYLESICTEYIFKFLCFHNTEHNLLMSLVTQPKSCSHFQEHLMVSRTNVFLQSSATPSPSLSP